MDTDADARVERGVRREHAVHAVQQEQRRTVPGRLGEQAVHQSVVHAPAAGQELPVAVRIALTNKQIVNDNIIIIHLLWPVPLYIFRIFRFTFSSDSNLIFKTRRFVPRQQ